MKIEIEAEYQDGVVDVYVGQHHVVTLPSNSDPYRTSEELIVTGAVANWLVGIGRREEVSRG